MWKVEIDEGTLNLLAALFTLGAAEKQISETNFVREPGKSQAAEKRANSLTYFDFLVDSTGGDFQGEDLKLETSDKWRLAKRELICFLPDSLDNDIGINYEDEDGVESAGKLTQEKTGMIVLQETDPVQDGSPTLHGDALEDGEHGEDDVVEAGDPLVGTLPVLKAH